VVVVEFALVVTAEVAPVPLETQLAAFAAVPDAVPFALEVVLAPLVVVVV
jgi:hypothetical protein